jgi:hypothetical protein
MLKWLAAGRGAGGREAGGRGAGITTEDPLAVLEGGDRRGGQIYSVNR